MTDAGFDFDELGDRLGVDDDTREVERPSTPPRRPIGQILQPPGEMPPVAEPITNTKSRRRRTSSASSGDTNDRRERGERSSANLPIKLVEQLAEYKRQHRWELSQLIDGALNHLNLDADDDPDGVLNSQWHGPRTARHYQLRPSAIERLDAVGEQWRMNRSQTITVLVVLEARRLGLASDE